MKTAVSIPDEVLDQAEALRRRTKGSRSQLYSRALAEYLARHSPDRVTERMDQVLADLNEQDDPFVRTASRRVLTRTEW